MELKHFYGCSQRLPPLGALPLGGELVPLYPLRAVDVWELWDTLRHDIPKWTNYFLDSGPESQRDASWVSPVILGAFRVLYRDRGEQWLTERMERATAAEIAAVYHWFVERHDWKAICEGLLGFRFDSAEPERRATTRRTAVEILFSLSEETGIRIEELIGMRAEAFVSFVAAAHDVWEEKATRYAAAREGGRYVSLDEFFAEGGIPPDFPGN